MTSKKDCTPGVDASGEVHKNIWIPINPIEVKAAFPSPGSAPGPDGLTIGELREVPLGILSRIFNIFILCGKIPKHLLESYTTLIPKKDGA